MPGERGVSSVVSTVLMVGIVVLVAIPAGIYAFQVAEPNQEPAPTVKRSNASMSSAGAVTNQTVSVTHGGGDTVDMADVEVVVRIEGTGESARVVDLPTSTATLSSSNVDGDNIVNTTFDVSDTPLSTASGDGEWKADETIRFQVESASLSAGDTVVVTFVHTETNSVLGEERFNASA